MLGLFHTRDHVTYKQIVSYRPFQSGPLLEHSSKNSGDGHPVLFLISGRKHPVFHCAPEGWEHLRSVSVSTADSGASPMSLAAVPEPQDGEVDLKGPCFPAQPLTSVILPWRSCFLASSLGLRLDHHADPVRTLTDIGQIYLRTHFACL